MRPLNHPKLDDISVEGILYALSDPTRVKIFMEIAGSDCPQSCSAFLKSSGAELAKSTLSQHFKILREAGLIRSERSGVELKNSSRCSELRDKFGSLVINILEAYRVQEATNS